MWCSGKKNLLANTGGTGSIPDWGRSPGEGNGNPLQHACLENSMDRGTWRAAVHGVAESWTRLSDCGLTHTRMLVVVSPLFSSCLLRG